MTPIDTFSLNFDFLSSGFYSGSLAADFLSSAVVAIFDVLDFDLLNEAKSVGGLFTVTDSLAAVLVEDLITSGVISFDRT